MSRRVGARIALVVVLVLAFGASGSSTAAAAVTFGSTLPAPTAGYADSCTDACTAAQIELPGAQPRSPADGTIVRFRLRTAAGSDAQKVKFRVLRSSNGVNFIGVGTSAAFDLPLTAGVTEFPVSMPVKAGDYIGIDQPGGAKEARIIARDTDAFQAGWFPTLADTGAARPSGNPRGSDPTRYDLLLQADVEPATAPPPTPTPTPGPGLREPPSCSTASGVATCADPRQPAVCGPTGLGFPQCSLPVNLPTACSGTGTAFPVCNLPGNHIVACGGLGLNLPVCNLPPPSVPQVCGPTTAGLPACTAANVQVLACGPPSTGLPACAFKTVIKAPKPIDINSGELDLVIGCPQASGASAARAVASQARCEADVDLADLVSAKRGALQGMALGLSWMYIKGQYPDPEFERLAAQHEQAARHNYVLFNYRARQLVLDYLKTDVSRGYSGDPFSPLAGSAALSIARLLISQGGTYPGVAWGAFEGPTELWQNATVFRSGREWGTEVVAAVNELYQVQERTKKKKSRRSSLAVSAAAGKASTRFHKHVKLRRGKRGTRIHLRLPRKTVRAVRGRASRKSHAVAVRLVISFKAKPRPIVRFVDFRIPVKQAKRAKRRR